MVGGIATQQSDEMGGGQKQRKGHSLLERDSYTQQVENLLDAELAKSLDLEQQMGALRQRLSAAEERASSAEGEEGKRQFQAGF
eukprot:127984-Pelagomonas_calceolata.AAC.1